MKVAGSDAGYPDLWTAADLLLEAGPVCDLSRLAALDQTIAARCLRAPARRRRQASAPTAPTTTSTALPTTAACSTPCTTTSAAPWASPPGGPARRLAEVLAVRRRPHRRPRPQHAHRQAVHRPAGG